MIYAEAMVGRRISNQYQWSPTLKIAVQALRYWHLHLKKLHHLPCSDKRLQQFQDEGNHT